MSRNYMKIATKTLRKMIGGMRYFKQRRQGKNSQNFR